MLYIYGGKIYIKPFDNKLIEVKISKKGKEYDVQVTEKNVEIIPEIRSGLMSISIEEAYNIQNKDTKKTTQFNLD